MNIQVGDPTVQEGENVGPLLAIGIIGFDMLALRYDASVPTRFVYYLRDDGSTWERAAIN